MLSTLRKIAVIGIGYVGLPLSICLAKKNKVLAYRIKGRRFDCGGVEGYVNAINYLAKRNKIL